MTVLHIHFYSTIYAVSKKLDQITLLSSSATSLTIGWSLMGNDNSSNLNLSESCPFKIKIRYTDNHEKDIMLDANQTSMPINTD